MELEDFVKGLKVGEHLKIETTGEKYILIELWCTNDGKYDFYKLNYPADVEELKRVALLHVFETAGKLLDYIAKRFADWLEYDFEIYKTRAELKSENAKLKSENAQLEKALKSACKIIEDGEICSECPANHFCLRNSDITCAENIYDELMKEAAKNEKVLDNNGLGVRC